MIAQHRKFVDEKLVERKAAAALVESESKALAVCKEEMESTEEARTIVQHVAQTVQQQAHERISKVVTRCLDAVFDDPYEFRIEFVRKRGKTEATMVFVREGVKLDDPMNEVGGGVLDVTALALRLATILITKPARRKLLVLDEPWKNIRGSANKARTRELLVALAEEMGVQIVLNTDIPEYRLGRVIELG